MIDLHLHTTASDGTDSPAELVRKALRVPLRTISITDHDTTSGALQAMNEARDMPLEILPGIELNTETGEREIHILGYGIDLLHPGLEERLCMLREKRARRAGKILEKLGALGLVVHWERVLKYAHGESIGRPHIARAMMEEGWVFSVAEAFEKYLGKGGAAYVPRFPFAPVEAVRLIQEAGGIPVLAHPGPSEADELIPELAAAGLRGLEVYYPDHSPLLTEHYLRTAKRYGLLATGGTDYHGDNRKTRIELGGLKIPNKVLEDLRAALRASGSDISF